MVRNISLTKIKQLILSATIIIALFDSGIVIAKPQAVNESEYQMWVNKIPVFPSAIVYDLKEITGIRMKMHSTSAKFTETLNFYLKELKKDGWRLDFPNKLEYEIWMEALNKDRSKSPNIMLVMSHPKTKLNLNLTIGVVGKTSSDNNLTIITVYLTETVLR